MPNFRSGDPQLVFTKKNGTKFTKTYHSKKAQMKSQDAWVSAGGKKPKKKNFTRVKGAKVRKGSRKYA